VNLSTQHFRAMRGQTAVYSLPTSTGLPSSATVPGRFRILDKIPNAYSRMWKLKMPYWMGIYWAGTAENGIHALPINRKGQTIWGNLLGPIGLLRSRLRVWRLGRSAQPGSPRPLPRPQLIATGTQLIASDADKGAAAS
jgi:hypothetical protein